MIALTCCAFHIGATSVAAAGAQSERHGGTFTTTAADDPKTLNLWVAAESSSANVVAPLFEPMLARNPKTLRWEGRLASLPTISRDGLRWTFRLRPNLKWSDNQPITADDVLFTLQVIYDESG